MQSVFPYSFILCISMLIRFSRLPPLGPPRRRPRIIFENKLCKRKGVWTPRAKGFDNAGCEQIVGVERPICIGTKFL